MRAEILDATKTVLLFEDSHSRDSSVELGLVQFGFRVQEATNSAEAVTYCRRNRGQVHVAVVEVAGPTFSGRQVLDRLATVAPGMPIVVISEQSWDDLYEAGVLGLEDPFFQKPFYPSQLAEAIYALLGAPSPIRPQTSAVIANSPRRSLGYSLFGLRNIAFL
ncbi:MAG: response regulator [Planctomycetes bacterium]|nr:response regulator [Planctomycetota bacterium]